MHKPDTMAASACPSALHALSDLVAEVCRTISVAREADEVKGALHSLASLLYLPDPYIAPGNGSVSSELAQLTSACQNEVDRILSGKTSMEVLNSLFYGSSLFPIVAKVLLSHVTPDWLACFSAGEEEIYFDSFFRKAPSTEAVLCLVPALTPNYGSVDNGQITERYTICRAAERLLVLCLFEDGGLRKIATESAISNEGYPSSQKQPSSAAVQLIASIPDRARPDSPSDLLSPNFYLSAVRNFLEAIEDYWASNIGSTSISKVPFVNAAELFSRFCRRGHADVVASAMLCKLLRYVDQNNGIINGTGIDEKCEITILDDTCKCDAQSSYLQVVMGCMNDTYALERLTKAIMLEMAERQLKDHEAYHILCILFSSLLKTQTSVRSLFTDRFLFWTVLPVRCLRWIMLFAVFHSLPENMPVGHTSKMNMGHSQKEVIRHIVEVWAEEKFITTAEMQQQHYVTVAVGLSLQAMTKADLESTNNLLQSLLKGISRRLESPLELVRKMAKRVALAFSLVINETEPLLLEDGDKVEDLLDWEELDMHKKSGKLKTLDVANKGDTEMNNEKINEAKVNDFKTMKKDTSDIQPIDPDEVIDLRTYKFNDHEDSSEDSDIQSECSIQPYDLSDDESDLQREKLPMQLTDCCTNLRKGDEPDLVERALDVVEKLIRAMPEELEIVASDLAHALIHVRCSDIAVEGQEETAEEKRYKALVALLACSPVTVKKFVEELYSPHMDVSQRLLVLEVMSDAARELSAIHSTVGTVVSGPIKYGLGQHGIIEIDRTWYGPGYNSNTFGAGPWREVNESNAIVSAIRKYEREIPYQQSNFKPAGKSRRWGHRSMELRAKQYRQPNYQSTRKNNFAPYAAAFMLPVMRDFDKIQHGVDLLGRDFVFLGRLICMLGVCIECVSLQPEAVVLALALLDMLRSRKISNHPEAYVKRAVLYAVSRVMISLHPSHVISALNSKDIELLDCLDWIRTWTMEVMDNNSDTECSSMAIACLNMFSELAVDASRFMIPS